MNGNLLKKTACLICLTAFGLCSCGRNAAESNENTALAKEHVYRFREIAIPEPGGDETDILAAASRDQTISLLIKVINRENYNDNDIRILRFEAEGSDAVMSALETIPWHPAPEDDAVPQEYSAYDNYTFGADGRIYAIRYYSKTPQGPDEESISLRYLCCWEADGPLLWEMELEDLSFGLDDDYLSINALSIAEDGQTRLILTGNEQAWQMTVDAQGNPADAEKLPEEIFRVFNSSLSVLHQADGCLTVICCGEDNWEERYFVSYHPAAASLGETCKMPSACGWDRYGAIAADDSGLIYSNRTGICSCTPGDEEGLEKMNFINSDLNITSFDALVSLDDASFAGAFYEGYDSRIRMGIFTRVDPADVPDKAVLVLAGAYISNDIIQRVVEFNRGSDQYRIMIQNLEEYDSEEALAAGIAETTGGIFSGSMPDILITEGLPAELYAANGFLADIGELLKEDEELSHMEFLTNVFDAYSMDGKLYYLIPSFRAGTMIGAVSVVGDRTSWTLADALELLETMPEETSLLPPTDREAFLRTMIAYCGSSLIDTGSGKCSFQSQEFTDILEYAKNLPEEPDPETCGEDYWRNYEVQYREGRTVLADMEISSFEDAPYYANDLFGADVSYIGFPCGNGSGAYIRAQEAYAISAHSKYLRGAWEFLRYYLTDEYQSNLETGLPVQKKYFLESSLKILNKNQNHYTNAESGTPECLTEEQLAKLIQFILSTDRCYYTNEDIMNIVIEEAGAFFSGNKTAQETAEVIQRRVQLYLDENLK